MTTRLQFKEQARSRAIATLRQLADRIESGEEMAEAEIDVGLLYEEDQEYFYATTITDSFQINMEKPSHYIITVKVAFPKKDSDAK